LFDLERGEWSDELCDLFEVPREALPEVVPSYGEVGRTDPSAFLGLELPVAGIAGDQQAALFGQACFGEGESKCTYGTGSFVLVNTGREVVRSEAGLLSTVAWMAPDGALTYALEGAIFVTGSAVQWLRDGLGIIGAAPESEALARTVPDSGGLVFVPALTGLGAPDWDPSARGTILGITRGTTRAHLVRATLEAIAFEVRDVVELLPHITTLRVDGGAAANSLLLQLQADTLSMPVERPEVLETTGLGAAFLAGLGTGVWSSTEELAATWRLDTRFEPAERPEHATTYERWRAAVERAKGWDVG
jgi:glycerol kinase